jgi:copper(I)-binding protein
MRGLVLSAIAASSMVMPAIAAGVTVSDGWFRALPANLPSGGYFTLHNGGAETVTLTGAESPACGMLMLHKTENKGGTGMMMDMPTITVPAGGDLAFSPGGYHLMCMNPTTAMTPGTTVPVSLDFADGSKTKTNFAVKNARGQ